MTVSILAAVATAILATGQAQPPAYDLVVHEVSERGCDPEQEDCAWVRLAYPRFLDSQPGEPGLRAAVHELLVSPAMGEDPSDSPARLAARFMDEFHASAAEDFASPAPWWLRREIAVVWSGPRALTLRMSESSYVGGAHPNHADTLLVLSPDGRRLGLDEILAPGARAELVALGERAFRAHHGLPPDDPLDAHGFWFDDGRFDLNDNWGVIGEGLVFHYNPYEIAAYAVGHTEILLPWDRVTPLLVPDSPVGAR